MLSYITKCSLIAMLVVACVPGGTGGNGSPERASTSTAALEPRPQERVLTIQNTTQGFVTPGFGIGAGNFRVEDYTEESGVTKHGPTVGLWLLDRESQLGTKAVRAYHGQEIEYGRFVVRVLAIRYAGRDSTVTVGVSERSTPAQ